jgi:YD repeat-containing protein
MSVTPPGSGATTYAYDQNGNQLNKGTAATFSWNALGQLTTASQGGTSTTNVFNGDGLRMSRTDNPGNATSTYTWDTAGNGQILDDSGADQYLYGATGLYAHVTSSQTYYYLTDGLGSVLAEVKSDGSNAVSYQYDVYGNIVNQQGSLYDERQFTGADLRRRHADAEDAGAQRSAERQAGEPIGSSESGPNCTASANSNRPGRRSAASRAGGTVILVAKTIIPSSPDTSSAVRRPPPGSATPTAAAISAQRSGSVTAAAARAASRLRAGPHRHRSRFSPHTGRGRALCENARRTNDTMAGRVALGKSVASAWQALGRGGSRTARRATGASCRARKPVRMPRLPPSRVRLPRLP